MAVYYISVHNYSKRGGVERTIILNPKYTKEEIAEVMRKEWIDKRIIREAMEKGIFQDREIPFVAKDGGMEVSWNTYKDGQQSMYARRKFAKRDKVTFHDDGTFSTEYYFTLLEEIEIFFESVCDKIKEWRSKNKKAA